MGATMGVGRVGLGQRGHGTHARVWGVRGLKWWRGVGDCFGVHACVDLVTCSSTSRARSRPALSPSSGSRWLCTNFWSWRCTCGHRKWLGVAQPAGNEGYTRTRVRVGGCDVCGSREVCSECGQCNAPGRTWLHVDMWWGTLLCVCEVSGRSPLSPILSGA